jgi:hypothetical protein
MAQGIGLAGGYGAGGVKDALVELLAQKMAERDFLEKQRQAGNAETLARETLGQRKTEASMEDARAKAGLRENQRQFGETLGLNVKKLGEDTRQFDTKLGEDSRQFDTGLEFKKGETTRDQGNTERGFGLKERELSERERANRAGESLDRMRVGAVGGPTKDSAQLDAISDMVLQNPDLLDKMTPTDRTRVMGHIATTKEGALPNKRRDSARAMLEEAQRTIKQLKTMKGREGAVGMPALTDPGSWPRLFGADAAPGSDAANYATYLETLGSQLTLPRLDVMKGAGALSDADVKMLKGSASSLSSRLSDPQFLSELDNVDTAVASALQRMGSGGGAPGGSDPGKGQQFNFDPKTGQLVPRKP